MSDDPDGAETEEMETKEKKVERGRRITVIFSNEGKEGNLELWVEPDETVGKVKDQVSHPSTINWSNGIAVFRYWTVLMADTPPPVNSHASLLTSDPLRPTPDGRYPPSPMAQISRRKTTETSINNGSRCRVRPQRSRINGR